MTKSRHSLIEDICAMIVGALITSVGITILRNGGIMTGGTAGLALLVHYALGLPVAVSFFALNLPFFFLGYWKMGAAFTVKSVCAVTLVSLLTSAHATFLHPGTLDSTYAALMGNVLLGVGILILLRHQISIGGVNILSLYLAEKSGFKLGYVQLAIDSLILLSSLSMLSPFIFVSSLAGAAILNMILAMNHRHDRYQVAR